MKTRAVNSILGNRNMIGKIPKWWENSDRGNRKTAGKNSAMVGNFPQGEKKSLPLHGSFSTAAPVLYAGNYLPLFSQCTWTEAQRRAQPSSSERRLPPRAVTTSAGLTVADTIASTLGSVPGLKHREEPSPLPLRDAFHHGQSPPLPGSQWPPLRSVEGPGS